MDKGCSTKWFIGKSKLLKVNFSLFIQNVRWEMLTSQKIKVSNGLTFPIFKSGKSGPGKCLPGADNKSF